MKRIALLGASGFVGSRMLEMFQLDGTTEVRPIVRSFGSLARLARFNVDWHFADALDEQSLRKAFEGCDAVVHSVHGRPDIITGGISPAYRAAQAAGVKRLVYLSTASVHGQAPAHGSDETTPLSDRQTQVYNNLKVCAERQLFRERERGTVEVVLLRPSIVFGPRSRWIYGLADELLSGTAYLVEGGKGVCNTIYVDNLIQAIKLALCADNVDGEAFLVGDAEGVTWTDFYRSVATSLEIPFESISMVSSPAFQHSPFDRFGQLRGSKLTQALLPYVPKVLKRAAKGALINLREPSHSSPWSPFSPTRPIVTKEMADLHQCRWRFPYTKAERLLGYRPPVTFDEGMARSLGWLRFAGYPVRMP